MPYVAIESLTLIAHLPDNLAHEQLHQEGLAGKNVCLFVLHKGGLSGRRLALNALLRHPHRMVLHFPLLILISPNGNLCTLTLSKRALILLTVQTRKMFDALYL
jgi:hypothetical protein